MGRILMQLALLIMLWLAFAWGGVNPWSPAPQAPDNTVTILHDGTPWPPPSRP